MLPRSDGVQTSAGGLLSEPSEPASFTRSEANYDDHSERFVIKDKTFQRQYAHIYASRLWSLRPKVESAAKRKWGLLIDILCDTLYYRP